MPRSGLAKAGLIQAKPKSNKAQSSQASKFLSLQNWLALARSGLGGLFIRRHNFEAVTNEFTGFLTNVSSDWTMSQSYDA
jgi:hypothetical protein